MRSEVEIIAALANACGLEWGQCHICGERPASCFGKYDSMVEREPSCDDCCGHACEDGHCDDLREMALEAWQAGWAAEHPGEPGPVREWTSEDGRVHWSVNPYKEAYVASRYFAVSIEVGGVSASWHHNKWEILQTRGKCTPADVAELARLMQAADGGA